MGLVDSCRIGDSLDSEEGVGNGMKSTFRVRADEAGPVDGGNRGVMFGDRKGSMTRGC